MPKTPNPRALAVRNRARDARESYHRARDTYDALAAEVRAIYAEGGEITEEQRSRGVAARRALDAARHELFDAVDATGATRRGEPRTRSEMVNEALTREIDGIPARPRAVPVRPSPDAGGSPWVERARERLRGGQAPRRPR